MVGKYVYAQMVRIDNPEGIFKKGKKGDMGQIVEYCHGLYQVASRGETWWYKEEDISIPTGFWRNVWRLRYTLLGW
jgi:hypothetical protein